MAKLTLAQKVKKLAALLNTQRILPSHREEMQAIVDVSKTGNVTSYSASTRARIDTFLTTYGTYRKGNHVS